MTRDKLCTLVKKWHTLIEAFAQARTSDGYTVRMFSIGFTQRRGRQVKATCYAKNSQQKLIRQKMMEIMVSECQKSTLKDLFKNFLAENVSKLIKKVKVLKKPKFDLTKLMELYQSNAEKQTKTADPTEPANSLSAGPTAGQ